MSNLKILADSGDVNLRLRGWPTRGSLLTLLTAEFQSSLGTVRWDRSVHPRCHKHHGKGLSLVLL